MKKRWSKLLAWSCVLGVLTSVSPGYASAEAIRLKNRVDENAHFKEIVYDDSFDTLPYYSEYLASCQGNAAVVQDIELLPQSAAATDGEPLRLEDDGGSPVLVMEEERSYIWRFALPQAGSAEIFVEYIPAEGGSILRSVSVNGSFPFQESLSVGFDRQYVDEGEIRTSANGDDIRPSTEEHFAYSVMGLTDSEGLCDEPFSYSFSAGDNSLTLGYISGTMKVRRILIKAPEPLPDYSGYLSSCPRADEGTDQKIWEAETGAIRNDPSIRAVCDTDAATVPLSHGDHRLNVLGDDRWSSGNQWAEWSFSVEHAGYYTVTFRAAAWYNDGRSAYRQIALDGAVPFRELLAYEIPYDRHWQNVTLSDKEGVPYRFYLTEGDHTLRLTVKVGRMASVSNEMERASLKMAEVLQSITKVTGYDIDPNYRYELDKTAPEVMVGLAEVRESVERMLEMFRQAEGNDRPTLYYDLVSAAKLLDRVREKPDLITIRYSELSSLQGKLSDQMQQVRTNAMAVDRLYVFPPEKELPRATASAWKNFVETMSNFLRSFTKDYSRISTGSGAGACTLRVWVSLGREWAEALRDLIDDRFSQEYPIAVDLNTFPAGQLNSGSANALMLAVNAGTAPDVGVGVSSSSVGEFAMRGVVSDISGSPGFEEFQNRFIVNAFVPYSYRDGVFGIPCTQDFLVTYYRKDILSSLHLGIPQTWDDVYSMMAVLNANGYQFYYPQDPSPFIFQNGADYYTEDLQRSAVDSPAFYRAFKQYTDLFINYRVPTAANFLSRFRTGEMPVGVAGYDMYVLLSTTAPELNGRWGMAMLPGTLKEDGSIDRSANTSSSTANIILSDSAYQKEAWSFLQWWMGEEVQLEYGRQVESILGKGARWNSAALGAFRQLPWTKGELEVITEQWRYNCAVPIVPGSYATGRYVGFAWTDIVISGIDARSALEEAATSIDKEMAKKYAEFS